MSLYKSDEEQLEALKSWWSTYSTPIIIVVSLLMLVSAGYRYASHYQEKQRIEASIRYEALMNAAADENDDKVKLYAEQIIKRYKNTVYADAAYLSVAKLYVTQQAYPEAIAALKFVIERSKRPVFRQVARIRYARIEIHNHRYSEALEQLKSVDDTAFCPAINELKGDVYHAIGHDKKASKYYLKAIKQAQESGLGNVFLEMKNSQLVGVKQSLKDGNKRIA